MSYKDFEFLRRKEFLILCILLIFLTFSQIALEISSKKTKTLEQVTTFIKIDHILIELLGLLLPVLIALFFFIRYKSKKNILQVSTREFFIMFLFIIFFLLVIPFPELLEEEEREPEINPENTTIITSTPASPTSNVQPSDQGNEPNLPEYNPIDTALLNNFLRTFRNILILLILLLPILIILLIQKKTKSEDLPSEIEGKTEEEEKDREKQYRIRSILECYYQASTVLEEKGANKSASLTPTEFNSDVIDKKLSKPTRISGLTELFEEAKFSSHDISLDKVEIAKTFTSKIIFNLEIKNRTHENNIDTISRKDSRILLDNKKKKKKKEDQ